jgi:hypothetical protein
MKVIVVPTAGPDTSNGSIIEKYPLDVRMTQE